MEQILIQIISATIGSIGFALVFNVKRDKFRYVIFGAFLGITAYFIADSVTHSTFVSNLIAAVVCTASAEFMARWRKAPATLFLIIHIIPLVPGGSLFYCMRSFVLQDQASFKSYGLSTLYASAGIAVGILLVTSFISIIYSYKRPEAHT